MGTAASNLRFWLAPWRWWGAALGKLSRVPPDREKHPFDRAHGVDTGGLIYADPEAEGHASGRHNAGYYATAPSLFHGAMALWRGTLPETGYAFRDYTLVDIGCGKGRVLMLATEYGFREIVGVELDPGLARVARKNFSRFGRRRWLGRPGPRIGTWGTRGVRIVEGDALTVPLPDGPVALFYFNSFEREMTEMWLARLGEVAAHRPWPIDLIYVHPEFDSLVRRVSGLQVLADAD